MRKLKRGESGSYPICYQYENEFTELNMCYGDVIELVVTLFTFVHTWTTTNSNGEVCLDD